MSGETQLTGPDLAQGIALSELPDGGQVLGHARGEAVLLVRRGEEIFAIGAACTHYGGPLGEGLVVDDTVRCPWHHACFSLRTGEPLRAPALNPVACFRVERRGERVAVGEKVDPPRRSGAAGPDPVVIVGAGAAGESAAEELRRQGYEGRILLLGPEPDPPYDRPNLSKDYLAGNAPEEWIPLHPPEWYEERKIELRLGARATAIDPQAKTVALEDGSVIPYGPHGALVLATGAEPVRLSIPGADLPGVHLLRSLADSRALIEAAKRAERAVVVGASFIGLEVAASLRAREVAVTVVAPEDRPLAKVMGPDLGDFIRALHEEHGVAFRLEAKPKAIRTAAAALEVELESGEILPADFVVLGVGVRPRVALAEAAGLQVDNGVVVDSQMRTSAPGIWAAGDIARFPDPRTGTLIRVEHWVVAQRQGQAAARSILGKGEGFDSAPFFWSQHYDVPINYVGHAARWDAAEVAGSLAERSATVAFRQGGKVLAVATIYRDRESLEAELAMERGDEKTLDEVVRR